MFLSPFGLYRLQKWAISQLPQTGFKFTKNWKHYALLPKLFLQMDEPEKAKPAYLYLVLYQLKDDQPLEVIKIIDQLEKDRNLLPLLHVLYCFACQSNLESYLPFSKWLEDSENKRHVLLKGVYHALEKKECEQAEKLFSAASQENNLIFEKLDPFLHLYFLCQQNGQLKSKIRQLLSLFPQLIFPQIFMPPVLNVIYLDRENKQLKLELIKVNEVGEKIKREKQVNRSKELEEKKRALIFKRGSTQSTTKEDEDKYKKLKKRKIKQVKSSSCKRDCLAVLAAMATIPALAILILLGIYFKMMTEDWILNWKHDRCHRCGGKNCDSLSPWAR